MNQEQCTELVFSTRYGNVPNYIAPGLDSWLLGQPKCKVRLFHMTRAQDFHVSPHNHRFDFACCVLAGSVVNQLYVPCLDDAVSDLFEINEYYAKGDWGPGRWMALPNHQHFRRVDKPYEVGEWYGMKRDEYHSIEFSRGAKVLFFEGPNQAQTSRFLEPVVNGKVIPLFSTPPWMYHE